MLPSADPVRSTFFLQEDTAKNIYKCLVLDPLISFGLTNKLKLSQTMNTNNFLLMAHDFFNGLGPYLSQ